MEEYEHGLFLVNGERDPQTVHVVEMMTEWRAQVRNSTLSESRSPRYWRKLDTGEDQPAND